MYNITIMIISIADFDKYLVKLPNLENPSVKAKLFSYVEEFENFVLDHFGVEFGELMLNEYDSDLPSDRSVKFFEGDIHDKKRFKGVKEAICKETGFRYILDLPKYVSESGLALPEVENTTLLPQSYYINSLRNETSEIIENMIIYLNAKSTDYSEFENSQTKTLSKRSAFNF